MIPATRKWRYGYMTAFVLCFTAVVTVDSSDLSEGDEPAVPVSIQGRNGTRIPVMMPQPGTQFTMQYVVPDSTINYTIRNMKPDENIYIPNPLRNRNDRDPGTRIPDRPGR